jgi:hypothetical protein
MGNSQFLGYPIALPFTRRDRLLCYLILLLYNAIRLHQIRPLLHYHSHLERRRRM